MKHTMDLAPAPFAMMESGQKTIELRLNDEKRQKIKIGDEIEFVNTKSGATLRREVAALYHFKNFEELYRSLPLILCGYTEETLPNASPRDMDIYYSPERQKRYGVVGIELKDIP